MSIPSWKSAKEILYLIDIFFEILITKLSEIKFKIDSQTSKTDDYNT